MEFKGFMGMEMDERIFFDMQKSRPWFTFFSPPALDLSKIETGEPVTAVELEQLIFSLIFGSGEVKQDLDNAIQLCEYELLELEEEKPKENHLFDNRDWMSWQNLFGEIQILLGTAYVYKGEYIKAAYHLMLGLKTDALNLNMPYCDFIRYIITKLDDFPKEEARYTGIGHEVDKPMGSILPHAPILLANTALEVIPEMEGDNGEVILARKGRIVSYGHVERNGSHYSRILRQSIDEYETLLIDKDYRLKTVKFYFNGYFDKGVNNKIITAEGFHIKEHTALKRVIEFIK